MKDITTLHVRFYDVPNDQDVYQSIADMIEVGIPIDDNGNDMQHTDDNLWFLDQGQVWNHLEKTFIVPNS